MNKENNTNQKKYCMCNVLFKGLEKDKVYRLYESIDYMSNIEFRARYIINNGEKVVK